MSFGWRLYWVGLALTVACSGARGNGIGSMCVTDDDCAGGVCEATQCVDSASAGASVIGKVEGAPGDVRIEQRVEGKESCKQRKGELICELALGSQLVLLAPKVEGYRFVEWKGPKACRGSKRELKLAKIEKSLECTAKYVRRLRVSGESEGAEGVLVVASAEGEFAKCDESSCVVDRGETVRLVAPEIDGYRIVGFEGEGCEDQEAYEVIVAPTDDDVTCTANYTESLTVRGRIQGISEEALAATEAQVSVSSSSREALCQGQLCAVDSGQTVTLLAPEVEGHRFRGFIGDAICASAETEINIVVEGQNVLCTADYVRRVHVYGESEGANVAIAAIADSSFALCDGAHCEVDEGETVTLIAGTEAGYRLKSWEGDGCEAASGSSAVARDVQEDRTCVAQFVEGVAVSGTVVHAEGEVTATSPSDGAECGRGSCAIDVGGSVTLTAPDLPGRTFEGWSGDTGCTGDTLSIVLEDVQESRGCEAIFSPRYRAEGVATPARGGTVMAASEGVNASCRDGVCDVDEGSSVSLVATENPGHRFTGWSGGGPCSGSRPRLELRDLRANITCNANFVARIEVSGEVSPSGAASVRASSLSSGAECNAGMCTVDSGSNVLLRADAATGWQFVRWAGCGSPLNPLLRSNPLLVAGPTSDERCTAYFERITYVVAAEATAGGSASVRAGSCTGQSCMVEHGESAAFSARPAAGFRFTNWSGDCSGSRSETGIAPVRANALCTAHFERITYPVTAVASPVEGGDVSCENGCNVAHGSSAQLSVTRVNRGYRFDGWSGEGCPTSADHSITLRDVTAARTCTARFVRQYTVSVNVVGAGTASCGDGELTSCEVDAGATVRIVAKLLLDGDSYFDVWTKCSAAAPTNRDTTVSVSADIECIANFKRWGPPPG